MQFGADILQADNAGQGNPGARAIGCGEFEITAGYADNTDNGMRMKRVKKSRGC